MKRGPMTTTTPPVGPVLDTSAAPTAGARLVEAQKPDLLLTQDHHMCPGCGEPIAVRQFLETITQLDAVERAIGVAGIGCYTSFSGSMDVDLVQALHGRAPSVATGVKRMLPDALVFTLQGASYVARGSVHNAGSVARTQKMFKRAFESQLAGEGFSFVEVLTMCPTGWFIPTAEGPDYMTETLGEVHIMGELKVDGKIRTTEELHADNVHRQREVEEALARGGLEKGAS